MLESFFNAIRNLWAVDELRKRVLFTLGMLAVYRAGIHVPVPGIDREVLHTIWGDTGNLFSVLDLFSGGNLRRISIFALSIMPYITASIILQLMTSVYPVLKKIQEEGEVGRQLKLSVTGLDESGKEVEQKATLWAAVPSDLAAVSEDGTISFFAPGEVRVLAVVGGKIGRTTIRIKPARVAHVEIDKPTVPLVVGGTLKLNASAIGVNGDPRNEVQVNWSSANPSVATVDAAGLLTGVAPGQVALVAKAEEARVVITLDVVKSNVHSVAITPKAANARTGDVVRFAAQAKDGGGAEIKNAAVRWTVSGEGAVVESDGGFVAERPGSYIVTATIGDQSSSTSVVVAPRNAERALVEVFQCI